MRTNNPHKMFKSLRFGLNVATTHLGQKHGKRNYKKKKQNNNPKPLQVLSVTPEKTVATTLIVGALLHVAVKGAKYKVIQSSPLDVVVFAPHVR